MSNCVLITTFNRGELLRNSLNRLTNLTPPEELIIVDDGSSDNTRVICEEFKTKLPLKYIYNNSLKHSICSMARNIGVKNTKCETIITSEPELLWITDMIPTINELKKEHPREIISASIIYHAQQDTKFNPGLITNPKEALKDEIVEEYQVQPRSYHPAGYCKTTNMQATFLCMYEKDWLMEIGGWDEGFPGAWGWDDIDLATRLRINGINQHISTELEAIHQWHPHLPPHEMGKASLDNERYMKDKQLNRVEEEILEKKRLGVYKETDPRLIANIGVEWGQIK